MGTLICEVAQSREYVNSYADDGTNTVTAKRAFLVESTSNSEGPRSILATSGLPNPWETHPEDSTIFAKTGRAQQKTDDPSVWICTFDYDDKVTRTEKSDTPGQPPPSDPTLQPTTIEYMFEKYSKIADGLNWDGSKYTVGLVNSAKEPWDPQPEFDDSRPTFVFTTKLKESSFNWGTLEEFQDAVNEFTIWGKLPRTLKVLNITAGPKQTVKDSTSGNTIVTFREVVTTIQYRKEDWKLKVLDQGTFSIDSNDFDNGFTFDAQTDGTGTIYPFKDSGENPTTRLLDGSGSMLPVDASGGSGGSGYTRPPVWITYNVYPEKPFSTLETLLSLPNPYA